MWISTQCPSIGTIKLSKYALSRDSSFQSFATSTSGDHGNGATLLELCEDNFFGAYTMVIGWSNKLDLQLRIAFRRFKRWKSRNKIVCKHSRFTTRLLSLNPKRALAKQTPKLKSKGRSALYINQWLLSICEQDTGSLHKQQRCSILWAFQTSFEVFSKGSVELTDEELSILKTASQSLFHNSRILCAAALASGRGTWRLIPKHHAHLHLFVHALVSRLNPGLAATWGDEDFVGWIGEACEALHKLTLEHQIVVRFIDHLRTEIAL